MAIDEKEKSAGWHDDLGDSNDERDESARYWEEKFNRSNGEPSQDASAKSPEEIKKDEESGGWKYENQNQTQTSNHNNTAVNFASKVGGPEAAAAFTALTALKSVFWGSKRRKQATIGAGIGGTLTGGALLGLVLLSGPLELIHLSQTLQHGFASSQHIQSVRGNSLLRYATAQNAGETRLGVLERIYLRGTISDLKDMGVDFNTNSNGNLTGVEIDTSNPQLLEQHPELKGMSVADKKAWIAENLNTSIDNVSQASDVLLGSDKFTVSTSPGVFLNSSKLLLKGVIKTFGSDGALSNAMDSRIFTKYFDIPSLFHPLQRAAAAAKNKGINATDAAAEEQDAQQAELDQSGIEANADPAVSDLENSSGFKSGLNALFLVGGGLCTLQSAGQDIGVVNQDRVVIPSEIMDARLLSIGYQMESGKDFNASQIDSVLASLTNSAGQSVFAGDAMQALEGSTSFAADKNKTLDLSPDYKQAFLTGDKASGRQMQDYAKSGLAAMTLHIPGGAAAACNTWVNVGIAAIQIASDAAGEILSAGTLTPVILAQAGSKLALSGIRAAPTLIGAAIATHFIKTFIVNSNTSAKLAKDAFSGPQGGDLLAYGARALGNTAAITSGGFMDAGSTLQPIAYNTQQQNQAKQQFESENFFARMFNTHDYRSLVGRLATSISPSFRQNILNFASDITNFGSVISGTFSNLFAAIFPHASAAATATYDWGFPQATIPDNILNSSDPTMADPYWNSCELFSCSNFTDPLNQQSIVVSGSLVDLQGKQTNAFNNYANIAKNCFNLNLTNNGGQWGGAPFSNDNVDVNSDWYIQNCHNTSDPIFDRLSLLSADTMSMDPMACASGDGQSCQDIGFNSSEMTNTPTGNSSGVAGNAQQLAQQILNNKNISLTGRDVQQDVQAAANGQPGTAGVMTSATILKLIETLGESHTITISAIQSGGAGHCNNKPKSACPNDPHYTGDAVDFSEMDGVTITGRNAPAITIMQNAFNILPSGSGFGQNECGSQYSSNSELPNNDITFNDTCNHLHVQVPVGTP